MKIETGTPTQPIVHHPTDSDVSFQPPINKIFVGESFANDFDHE